MLAERYLSYGAKNFAELPRAVLSIILVGVAAVALFGAFFVQNIWIKAVLVAYFLLP